jgi:hypothetical protein
VVCTKVQLKGKQIRGGLKGKIKKVDTDQHTVTVTIGDKDREFQITDATKLLGPSGKDLKGGLESPRLKEGAEVTVLAVKKGGKEVCTTLQLKGQKRDK